MAPTDCPRQVEVEVEVEVEVVAHTPVAQAADHIQAAVAAHTVAVARRVVAVVDHRVRRVAVAVAYS